MLKAGFGLIGVVVLGLFAAGTPQHGCQDAVRSLTHLAYYPKRDMRSTVVLVPQNWYTRAPDSLSVPVTGKEFQLDREVLAAKLTNPIPASDSSIARGERKFMKTCIPCHGNTMAGDGPVVAKFIP